MKNNPFSRLNKFERMLWCGSMLLASAAFLISGSSDVLSLIASLTGATTLIFVAKGEVLGQILTVVFAVLYAILSWNQRYYGEMITYLGMSAPIAAMSVVSWLRHPYRDSAEVEVHQLTGRQKIAMLVMTALTTFAFYYILRAFGTASLPMSTVSVATSFLASYLMFFRNPHYALAGCRQRSGADHSVGTGVRQGSCLHLRGGLLRHVPGQRSVRHRQLEPHAGASGGGMMCSISYKRLLFRRFFDFERLSHLNQGSAVLEEHSGIGQEIRNLCRIVILSMAFESLRQILIAGYMQDQTIKDLIWEVSV